MTPLNQQMYDDFQMVYNNLSSNLAAGLTPFEISMYLTKAYFNLVNNSYKQYEQNEEVRKSLADLVETKQLITPVNAPSYKIVPEAQFYALPTRTQGNITTEDVLYIVYESLTYGNAARRCLRGKTIQVIPIGHDDFHQVYENPYRFNNKKALRLDVTIPSGSTNIKVSEIVSKDSHIAAYTIRYIRKPKPIILEQLTGDDRIEGLQTETECEVNSILHPQIVRLAAQMAYQDYKAA